MQKAKEKMTFLAERELKEENSLSNVVAKPTTGIDIFISYSWADKDRVRALKQILDNSNYKSWIDDGKLHGGLQLFDEIDQGISAAKVFLSCVSDNYGGSKNCKQEILLATHRSKLIIPVIISTCSVFPPRGDMGPLLAGKLYIDLRDENLLATNSSQLLSAIAQSI